MKTQFVWILLFLLSACSDSKLPKYSVLQGLRTITLQTDVPELLYDGTTFTPTTVNITPWASDLYGGGRQLKFNLEWCLDPGVSYGATPSCAKNPTRTVLFADQNVIATATFLAPNFTGALTPRAVDFSAAAAPIQAIVSAAFISAGATRQFNGLNLLIIHELYPDGNLAEKVTSFKRIVISSAAKPVKNANPAGLEIRQNGTEITGLPGVESLLEAFIPAAQVETYSVMSTAGLLSTKTEVLETTWFLTGPADVECSNKKECTTDGLFSLTRTKRGEFNTFYVPVTSQPTTRGRVLIAVARDGRGGGMVRRYCTGTCP